MRRCCRRRRQLKGKRVLLTGASSGIGRCLAEQLAEQGAKLVLLARNESKLNEVADSLRDEGAEVVCVIGDVTDSAVRATALAQCEQAFGGLDLLINNAGVGAYGRFVEVSADRLRTLMEVNLFAVAELTREATPLLKAGNDAAIINIGSILGCRGIPFSSEYCASKFALHGLSESIRPELEKLGIELTLVAPGATETGFKENVVDNQGKPPWGRSGGVPADRVARATLRAVRRRRRMIIPNMMGRLMVLANRIAPRLLDRLMNRYG